MINLNLAERFSVTDNSVWKRTWVGYDPLKNDAQNFDQNRGVYNINAPRAKRERIITMSLEHTIRIVAALDDVVDVPLLDGRVKQALVGHVLAPGNPDYDRLIGTTITPFRNPVRYIPDGLQDLHCLCGCGTPVTSARRWVPGHDQRALHDRVTEGWGSVERFIRWYDDERPTAVSART